MSTDDEEPGVQSQPPDGDGAGVAALQGLSFDGPPTTIQELEKRVEAIARALDIPVGRAKVLVSSVIVAQMLPPDTIIKGGIGVKLRLGDVGTRATKDVDVVSREREGFLAQLSERLENGWGTVPASRGSLKKNPGAPPRVAFTGKAREDRQARPDGVPPAYLMKPYKVSLAFMGTGWASVPVEVAHDEIGGMDFADTEMADQITALGEVLGLDELAPVPLISLEQQIAQKIHAVTEPGSQRPHDLVDLQLLWRAGTAGGQALDMVLLARLCRRTFDYRHVHEWPPGQLTLPDQLEAGYQSALEEARPHDEPRAKHIEGDLGLAPTLTEATSWLTHRIKEIVPEETSE